MNLSATLQGKTFTFRDVKDVLAKANEEKSGDKLAGVAAGTSPGTRGRENGAFEPAGERPAGKPRRAL